MVCLAKKVLNVAIVLTVNSQKYFKFFNHPEKSYFYKEIYNREDK